MKQSGSRKKGQLLQKEEPKMEIKASSWIWQGGRDGRGTRVKDSKKEGRKEGQLLR